MGLPDFELDPTALRGYDALTDYESVLEAMDWVIHLHTHCTPWTLLASLSMLCTMLHPIMVALYLVSQNTLVRLPKGCQFSWLASA
jgi:hypothetical protein